MTNIKQIFTNLATTKQKAFVPFIAAGDSGLDNTLQLMHTLADNGADVIELGVPFSDPMADGVIIQRAYERCVAKGISLTDVLALVAKFRENNQHTALVLMTYLNVIEIMGYQHFAKNAQKSGVNGVLIVDMPPEESTILHQHLSKQGIDLIFLVSPTTTVTRLNMINKIASGFVYFITLKGVTGAANIDVNLVKSHLKDIKKIIKLPICLGFGISDAKTAKTLSYLSDGIVIGSAIVKLIEQHLKQHDKMNKSVAKLTRDIKTAISG